MGVLCCKGSSVPVVQSSTVENQTTSYSTNIDFCDLSVEQAKFNWTVGQKTKVDSYCETYHCINSDSGEFLILRVFYLTHPKFSRTQSKQLKQELMLLKDLSHRHISTYRSLILEKTKVGVFYEYSSGGNLKNLLKVYGKLKESVIKSYTIQLLKALDYLHSKGVILTDLSPSSVSLYENSLVKISKFKHCVLHYQKSLIVPLKKTFYLAPEVINFSPYKNSDIWSLGCLLIHLVTGKTPWHPLQGPQVLELLRNSCKLPPMPDASPSLVSFVCNCLQRDARSRPSASELMNHEFVSEQKKVSRKTESLSSTLTPDFTIKNFETIKSIIQEIDSSEGNSRT